MEYTIILLRHGQSEWNRDDLFCGWVDIPLSDKGKQQARDSARLIAESGLDPKCVFTSKLTRSCQTANIILEQLHREYLDVYRSWTLNERHYGTLQGRSKSDVLQELGKDRYMFIRRAFKGCPPLINPESQYAAIEDSRYEGVPHESLPLGESLEMVTERLLPYFESTIEGVLKEQKTVLIATHGSIMRALVKHLYGISEYDISEINIPNGIPMVIRLDESFKVIGDYTYLDPEVARVEAEKVARQGFKNHS
ncbi:unnamed protein product [Kuraishia capsulata CBS 1993]|uniref:Phosphoglycerate mutase n=1 Tax=Kuraishia capsulata CBS 1993 TaxID=1382522 RepID=W6MX09_9ASCO|nr:uncharacterized protein KUCA_T00004056001 [Kuraishia capsulata CBS 1993]CDK28075.1 unnamed protein product [Kuraishia capsulata CBS 1993]